MVSKVKNKELKFLVDMFSKAPQTTLNKKNNKYRPLNRDYSRI